MQKSELRLPKQQLELALVNIGPFWHPDGNSFELTQGPLDLPWNLEQMQLVLPDYFPSRKALSLIHISRNPYIVVDVLTNKRRDLLYQLALILDMGSISQHGPLRVGIGIGGSNIAGYIQQ